MRRGNGVLARALSKLLNPLANQGEVPPLKPVSSGKWSDFGIRLASASILAPSALLALWRGSIAWQALVAVAMVGLAGEWTRLAGLKRWNIALFVAVAVSGLLAMLLGWVAGLLALLLFTLATAWRFGWFAAVGIPYIGIGGFSLLWLRLQPLAGLHDTLFLVAVIWSTDIGAYLAGRLLGGAKLAPRISPGKTWSGSAGGLIIAGLIGGLLDRGGHGISLPALAAALLLSLCAQAGDLLESAIKRKLGVKDSGRTIPGHGGLFDRLDGFLAAAPVAVILALWAHHGGSLMVQGVMP
jgi:phosphatidate cytidylyltransferase